MVADGPFWLAECLGKLLDGGRTFQEQIDDGKPGVLEEGLELFALIDDKDIVRIMDRFARKAELRSMPSFRDNCPG